MYAQSQLETSFGINNVAIVDRVPKVLNLKELLEIFLSHRRSVVSRRTAFDLAKSKDRGHILEGLTIALSNIDPIIDLIKKSKDPTEAKRKLLAKKWKSTLINNLLKMETF